MAESAVTAVTKEELPIARSPGVAVVLNGGKRTMDSATLPIQWYLSPAVIEKNPYWVLIFLQNEREAASDNDSCRGRRFIGKVSDAIRYLQMLTPGKHRLAVLVFSKRKDRKCLKKLLERERSGEYERSLPWDRLAENNLDHDYIIASTVVEFEVPAELFAKKPTSGAAAALWEWTNLLFNKEPVDECAYRQRLILAFTVQPILVLLFSIFYGICAFVYASYVFFASLIVFFCGFRPKPILKEIWAAVTFEREKTWSVVRFGKYRMWAGEKQYGDYGDYQATKKMPITGVEICLLALGLASAIFLFRHLSLVSVGLRLLLLIGCIVSAVILLLLFGMLTYRISVVANFLKQKVRGFSGWWQRLEEQSEGERSQRLAKRVKWLNEKQRRARERQEARALQGRQWLETQLGLAYKPLAVNLSRLPKAPTIRGRVVQRFYVGYWGLKAKICRPYPKQ